VIPLQKTPSSLVATVLLDDKVIEVPWVEWNFMPASSSINLYLLHCFCLLHLTDLLWEKTTTNKWYIVIFITLCLFRKETGAVGNQLWWINCWSRTDVDGPHEYIYKERSWNSRQ
jgi:hypothetical protein